MAAGSGAASSALFDAYNDLIPEVFRLNGSLIASGDALTKDLGLTSARWQVLGAIILSPVPLPVAPIARNMGLTRQGVQRTVDDLKRLDMVRTQDNPHHRRAMLVLATDKGSAAFRTALERHDRWMTVVDPDIAAEQLGQASAVLRQFRTRLDAAGSPAAALRLPG